MDKYGVEIDQTKEKTASESGACPACGTTLSKDTPNHCTKCGTKPFEKTRQEAKMANFKIIYGG